MIARLSWILKSKQVGLIIVVVGGIGLLLSLSEGSLAGLPPEGSPCTIFTHLHVREDALQLYGFLDSFELEVFESLISVSGIGPRSALSIMGVASVRDLAAAINEGKVELLTSASGVGKKTAERVILELKGKLPTASSAEAVTRMSADQELEETLISLGYSKGDARAAIAKIPKEVVGFKERLREALKKRT